MHFEDQAVLRSYTPTFPVLPGEDANGTFQLLIKTYFPDKEKASPGGTVSNYLDCLQIGELSSTVPQEREPAHSLPY